MTTCPNILLHTNRGAVVDVTITTNQPAGDFATAVLQIGDTAPIVAGSVTEGGNHVTAQFLIPDSHTVPVGAHVYEVRLDAVAGVGLRPLGIGVAHVLPEPTPTN